MKVDIAVTGGTSGLGLEVCKAIAEWPGADLKVIAVPSPQEDNGGFDLTSPDEIYAAAEYIGAESRDGSYRVLINCAGINYIEWFPRMDWAKWDELHALNLRAPVMLTQELIKPSGWLSVRDGNWFEGRGAVLNIISNASHVPMTNSVAYNATKGGLHIATLAMARELFKTHGLRVFGISPNKLSGTSMSKYIEAIVPELRGWTPEQAQQYQLQALPTGEETDPAQLAEFIAFLLSSPDRHRYLHGTVIPYGG